MSTEYISATEAARSVRKVLKANFPGFRFSVRTRHGAEIRIAWTDGPSEAQVKPHVWGFDGRCFDGMIDLAYSSDSWYNPETGEASFAYTAGTYGNGGSNAPAKAPNPWPGVGYLVHFSASVVCARTFSKEVLEKVAAQFQEKYGAETPEITVSGEGTKYESWYFQWDFARGDQWAQNRLSAALTEYSAYTPPEKPQESAPSTDQEPGKVEEGGLVLEYCRDWTWAYCQGAPGERETAALKSLGFKHSPRRSTRRACSAWFARKRVDLSSALEVLRHAYWKDYVIARPDLADWCATCPQIDDLSGDGCMGCNAPTDPESDD
jgi:hypothetical protein